MRSVLHAPSLCALAMTLASAATAQPATMFKDIVTSGINQGSQPGYFTTANGALFFVAWDLDHGSELWTASGPGDAASLVRDICPGVCDGVDRGEPSLVAVGDLLFFQVTAQPYRGLWVSDGTLVGTRKVAAGGYGLTAGEGRLYFTGWDEEAGWEPWLSDGTPEGTRRIADIDVGDQTSYPRSYTELQGRLFFVAEGGPGSELWVLDDPNGAPRSIPVDPGSEPNIWELQVLGGNLIAVAQGPRQMWFIDVSSETATLLADFGDGGGLGRGPDSFVTVDTLIFFVVSVDFQARDLWRTDGTPEGTYNLSEFCPGGCSSIPEIFGEGLLPIAAAGERLVFIAEHFLLGAELWSTNGLPGGAVFLGDQRPGEFGVVWPYYLVPAGTRVYFNGDDGFHGNELWSTDGTPEGTTMSRDLIPGSFSSYHDRLTPFGNEVYMVADGDDLGAELWRSDGTEAGTRIVKDIQTGFSGSDPSEMTAIGNRVFFSANDGVHGNEPWISDGTEQGTVLLQDVAGEDNGSQPRQLTAAGTNLFFTVRRVEGSTGDEDLWVTDGSSDGTTQLVVPSANAFWNFTPVADHLYFNADSFSEGTFLWKSDGTSSGTVPIGEVHVDGKMAVVDEVLYFASFNELWRSDGTDDGTYPIPSYSGPPVDSPQDVRTFGDILLFSARDEDHGRELWRSDGTPDGTGLLFDIAPGFSESYTRELTPVGSIVIFSAADSETGRELWRTDGTSRGTRLVADIQPGYWGSLPSDLTVVDRRVFFLAEEDDHGRELWGSDGTTEGTSIVADLTPGEASSSIEWLTEHRNILYFVFDDGVHGKELWRSDGTEAGTHLVRDIQPGAASASPSFLESVGRELYFAADDGLLGFEMFRTDGTNEGTELVQDIAPMRRSSSPQGFAKFGRSLFFQASDGELGAELWSMPVGNIFSDGFESGDLSLWSGSSN